MLKLRKKILRAIQTLFSCYTFEGPLGLVRCSPRSRYNSILAGKLLPSYPRQHMAYGQDAEMFMKAADTALQKHRHTLSPMDWG